PRLRTCAWRIRKSSQNVAAWAVLVRCRHRANVDVDDSPAHTRRPLAGHHCQTPAPGRSTRRRGRIPVAKAPVGHQQARAAAGAELEFFRSLRLFLKPRTLLRFHEALKKRNYRWLFSSGDHRRPGPKGPSKELIDTIVEFKRRNPRIGCPRIAQPEG